MIEVYLADKVNLILEVPLVKHVLSELLLEVVRYLLFDRLIRDFGCPSYRTVAPRLSSPCDFKAPTSAPSAIIRFVILDFRVRFPFFSYNNF